MNANLTELQAHLTAIRTRTEAWVAEDPANRWACYPVDDAQFWAERGITTVEAYEHDSLMGQVSDQYKSVYGYRPRHLNMREMTVAELRAVLQDLDAEWAAQRTRIRQERIARKLAAKRQEAATKAQDALVQSVLAQQSNGFPVAVLAGL